MKWYIGQPIVAIKNHHQKFFKKGDEFTIQGIMNTSCKCNHLLIDIGVKDFSYTHSVCRACNTQSRYHGYFHENSFAPLDVDISELTNILEQESTNHA